MYDPRSGRFTQQDPLLGNRPFEHYAYAGNNPVSRVDPMGDKWKIKSGPGSQAIINNLADYFGATIHVTPDGTVTLGAVSQKQFASAADLEWFRRVEKDASETDITGFWSHMINGDDWHRGNWSDMMHYRSGLESPGAAALRGAQAGSLAFDEGATFGARKAPQWARDSDGFNISRGIGMATASAELALTGIGLGTGTFAAGAGASLYSGTTVAGTTGGVSMGFIEAGGALAVYGAATYDSREGPDPTAAGQTVKIPLLTGMMGHLGGGGGQPRKGITPLKNLHPRSSMSAASLEFWGKKSTDDIVVGSRNSGADFPEILAPMSDA
jgi:hypothetical protein